MKTKHLIPFFTFLVLVVLLWVGLSLNPREVPSPFIGKPRPDFVLPNLHNASQNFNPAQMDGKVWMLNIWASWCTSCRAEHRVVTRLANAIDVDIVGLNYKDEQADAQRWLQRYGDPYLLSVMDVEGRTGIDWGVYGVPETFVIDKKGIVRYKQIGPLTQEAVDETVMPLLIQLQAESI